MSASPGISIRRATPDAAACDILGFRTVIPWNTFTTREFDLVATMGTSVDERDRRRRVGAALAAKSLATALEMDYEKILTDLGADSVDSPEYHLALGFTLVGAARRQARVAGATSASSSSSAF